MQPEWKASQSLWVYLEELQVSLPIARCLQRVPGRAQLLPSVPAAWRARHHAALGSSATSSTPRMCGSPSGPVASLEMTSVFTIFVLFGF